MMIFLIALITFCIMEGLAWALHKYVMHGWLWFLHQDHHVLTGRWYQKNDIFVLVFALPSFLMIYYGSQIGVTLLMGIGYGVMIYGIIYGVVHEVIIHRRWHFFRGRGWYFKALILAHREHHKQNHRLGATNFGMLWVSGHYLKLARQNHAK